MKQRLRNLVIVEKNTQIFFPSCGISTFQWLAQLSERISREALPINETVW